LFGNVEFQRLCLFWILTFTPERAQLKGDSTTIRHGRGRESRFAQAETEYGRESVRLAGYPHIVVSGTLTTTRMELALAELALEEPQEAEEDVDFVVDKGTFRSFLFSSTLAQATLVRRRRVRGGGRV
jgi:hypothetical protein